MATAKYCLAGCFVVVSGDLKFSLDCPSYLQREICRPCSSKGMAIIYRPSVAFSCLLTIATGCFGTNLVIWSIFNPTWLPCLTSPCLCCATTATEPPRRSRGGDRSTAAGDLTRPREPVGGTRIRRPPAWPLRDPFLRFKRFIAVVSYLRLQFKDEYC